MTTTKSLTKRQGRAYAQRPGENIYGFLARTIRTLRFRDLPELLLLRNNDGKQVEAIQLYSELKMVQWTRALTIGTLMLGPCTIVAALIARG